MVERLQILIALPIISAIALIIWFGNRQTNAFKRIRSAVLYGDINYYKKIEGNKK